jgi:hypothetical protein
MLPVENPGCIIVRRVQQPCGRKLQVFSPKRRDHHRPSHRHLFEEALVFESPRSMKEDTAPLKRSTLLGGVRATRSSSIRFTEPQGRTEEPLVRPRHLTRSSAPPPYASRYSEYGFIIMTEEEEKKLTRLEERLVENVDFDDQALHVLGFHADIYYMLGHLGWVQSSNGVSANTHEEFTLEILMTMAHIFDEECRVSHSI